MLIDNWKQMTTSNIVPPIASVAAGVIAKRLAKGVIRRINAPARTPIELNNNQPTV
jgi:hypothetical protein